MSPQADTGAGKLRRRPVRVAVGITDQAVSSASNLVLAVLIARSVDPHEFGAFAVVYAVYVLAIGASLSLNGEFYSMRFAGEVGDRQRVGAQQAAGGALLIGLTVGIGLVIGGLLLRSTPVSAMLVVLAGCLPVLLLQDSLRNVLIASGRAHLALAGDTLWLGSFVAVGWFIASQRESAVALLLLWGVLGGLSALVMLPTVGLPLRPLSAVGSWRRERRVVRPLFAEFVTVEGAWQLTTLLLPLVIGLSALGGLRAAMVIFGPLNVLFSAARSVAVPELVRVRHRGVTAVIRGSVIVSLVLSGVLLLLGMGLLLLPDHVGHALFGSTWLLAVAALAPVAVARAIGGVAVGALVGLRALSATGASFRARRVSAATGAMLILVGGYLYGAFGAAWGMAVGAVVTSVLLWCQLAAQRKASTAGSSEAAPVNELANSVLWVTNIPVPYRIPVWGELCGRVDLHIVFQAHSEPNRDWDLARELAGLQHRYLDARAFRRGPTPLYLPSSEMKQVLRSRKWSAVVIDGWESPAYWQALLWARQTQTPVIALYRSTLASRRFARGPVAAARRLFLQSCSTVITAGQDSEAAVTAYGVSPDRVRVVFNPVDVERIAKLAAEIHASAHGPIVGHRFLVVGQLIERKNVASVLDAFAAIRKPSDTLTIVGTGPLEATLREQSLRMGTFNAVQFVGAATPDEVIAWCARSHTMILASTEEVWGLVVNEALAAGMHAVVSERTGVASAVRDMTGVFVSRPDADALANAMSASRSSWIGPTADPAVLRHGPGELADTVLSAAHRRVEVGAGV